MLPKIYQKLKSVGRVFIDSPHYWLAYTFMDGRAFKPVNVDWELTFRCNLACKMCPQELYKVQTGKRRPSEERELDWEEMRRVADDLARTGVKVITLTGGEPFLHPQALKLAKYIKSKGMACNILTNGGVFNESMAGELVKASIDAITFSLDGPRGVHDETRGRQGAFDKLSNTVHMLRAAKKKKGVKLPSLAFNCTISALNQHCFSELLDVAEELGVPTLNFAYLFFASQQAVNETGGLIRLEGVKEENQVLPEYLKTVDTEKIREQLARCRKHPKQRLHVNILPPLEGKELDLYFSDENYSYCGKCFLPWYAGRINPYGVVYPCSIDFRIGSVRERPFSEMWNGAVYGEFRRKLKQRRLFPKCKKCCMLNNKMWDRLPPRT